MEKNFRINSAMIQVIAAMSSGVLIQRYDAQHHEWDNRAAPAESSLSLYHLQEIFVFYLIFICVSMFSFFVETFIAKLAKEHKLAKVNNGNGRTQKAKPEHIRRTLDRLSARVKSGSLKASEQATVGTKSLLDYDQDNLASARSTHLLYPM